MSATGPPGKPEPVDEIRNLLVITVVIGLLLMSLLFGCYFCVFRRLYCADDEPCHAGGSECGGGSGGCRSCRRISRRRRSCGGSGRDGGGGGGGGGGVRGSGKEHGLCMGELTHFSSQQATETEVV